ncbi:MAG: DUF3459 domain-containing protein, partial [Chloroflexi bacterium]|nr:DUF3459 domain-containing protein [Chloroflexota bacterium]
ALEETIAAYPPGQFGTFLTNHDQPRVATELGGDIGRARVAATILLTAPGAPFIYYGEEIGMMGTKPDERIRTPMAWDASEPAAGFSDAAPWQPLADGLAGANVAAQRDDPASLLAQYRDLVRVRAASPALRSPDALVLPSTEESVLVVVRRAEAETVLVLANVGDRPVSGAAIDLSVALPCGATVAGVEVLLGDADVTPPAGDLTAWVPVESLDAHESVVVRLTP